MTDRITALADFVQLADDDIRCVGSSGELFECTDDRSEWLVLTNDEANERADEALESYIDECIIPELPDQLAGYFDRDAWKRDALLSEGRGHTLATYNGAEEESGEFFIYRVN